MNLNLTIEYTLQPALHATSHSGDQNTRYSRIKTTLGRYYISESPLNNRRGPEQICVCLLENAALWAEVRTF